MTLFPNAHPLAPHNRLGLDYRAVPQRAVVVPEGIIDAHTHTGNPLHTQTFVDAAHAYGITKIWTMAGLEFVPDLQQRFPGLFEFIAVPAWSKIFREGATADEAFLTDWMDRLDKFHALGSRLIKFHNAPFSIKRFGMNLMHPNALRVADHAYKLGYHFMSHVGDPKAWFFGSGKYAKPEDNFGSFASQFDALDRFLEKYPDRIHLGAHMGGSLEALDLLAKRLDKYPHYVIDTSATKWIVRAVAEAPALQAVKDFILAYQDRILFGSDLVVGEKYDFDHYASRYWVHHKLWETDYRGQSPIEDPDAGKGFNPRSNTIDPAHADGTPHLTGLALPPAVLQKLYRTNALRWLPRADYNPLSS